MHKEEKFIQHYEFILLPLFLFFLVLFHLFRPPLLFLSSHSFIFPSSICRYLCIYLHLSIYPPPGCLSIYLSTVY
ncbi:hypothetical protein CSUI_005704 [Cystoisospora suis]|uniref:Transmembrane protein n=1 Tax=Cystoisospora suis TaxID=483139 RepID=A0A2C6KWN5_9APIC|nr:hypothetical protein CSUI_005704 [Cystoisospora suis]